MSCKTDKTLTFDEKVKGWTSFHSFLPDFMVGMNNKFFTFKNGELYEHHSNNVDRNNYYGVSYPSKISLMVNDNPSDIKELQALSLEGNQSWETLIRAYVSNSDDFMESSITSVEFIKKEGIWFAYARRNESANHYDSKSTYGLGRVSNITPTTFQLSGGSTSLCVGDKIIRGSDLNDFGIISDITGDIITVPSTTGLLDGDFVIGMKDPRIEGGNLRGYTLRVDLENDSTSKVELFAVNAEVMKSFS